MEKNENAKEDKKKGFFAKMIEKLDKNLEEKYKKKSCCGGSENNKGKGSSCC